MSSEIWWVYGVVWTSETNGNKKKTGKNSSGTIERGIKDEKGEIPMAGNQKLPQWTDRKRLDTEEYVTRRVHVHRYKAQIQSPARQTNEDR